MAISGKVTNIESREVKTKFGLKPVYDVYVDGNKFSWGFKDPVKSMVSVGSTIEYDFTSDKFGHTITPATVKVLSMGTGAPATPAAPSVKSPPSGSPAASGGRFDAGFPIPVLSEKISICRQNALTNARELVQEFPSIFGGEEYNAESLVKAILDTARAFADYTTGRDATRAVEEMTAKMEKE